MRYDEALRVAAEALAGKTTATCSVCGRVGALTHNGRRMRPHNRTIVHREADEHGPAVEVTTDCRGSRRPPLEYVEAFNAAHHVSNEAPSAS